MSGCLSPSQPASHGWLTVKDGEDLLERLRGTHPDSFKHAVVQSERYKERSSVGLEAFQAFVGALTGKGKTMNIFVITVLSNRPLKTSPRFSNNFICNNSQSEPQHANVNRFPPILDQLRFEYTFFTFDERFP